MEMDIETAQSLVINWIGQAPWDDKYNFVGCLLRTVTPAEVKTFGNMCNKTLRNSKRMTFEEDDKLGKEQKGGEPVESAPKLAKAWYKYFPKKDIVGFEVKHVHYEHMTGLGRIKAATVAIVDYKGNAVYSAKIDHEGGSFKVNPLTGAGFTEKSLEDGRPMEEVKKEVQEFLVGKLVITHSGVTNFARLGLNADDFNHFDIAEYFQRPRRNKQGVIVIEKISLRKLSIHYFKQDIITDVHSPEKDAGVTMKIFMEVYTALNPNLADRSYTNYDLFENIR